MCDVVVAWFRYRSLKVPFGSDSYSPLTEGGHRRYDIQHGQISTAVRYCDESIRSMKKHSVLAVDLDGTLLCGDLLHECVVRLLKYQPWKLFY